MLEGVNRHRGNGRPFLAWFGLLLMAGSFVWLQFSPPLFTRSDTRVAPVEEPFTVVVLDPGHGGQDSGTMRAGILEKELTLDVAHRARRRLELQGVAVLLTRNDDTQVSLSDRAAVANEQHHCIFISLHFDHATRAAATGIETYYAARQVSKVARAASWLPFLRGASLEPANVESQNLAALIQEALVARTQAVNRGTTPQQFFVLANVRHPAVLVEGGFLTNADDISKLATEDYREQIAAAISDGVMRYQETSRRRQTPLAVSFPGGE
jgi:N-acetylmuramoyl-L-alanine amidase